MTPQLLRNLRHLEGHHVHVRLTDETRLDCELVSAPRRGAGTVWLHPDRGDDMFVPADEVADVRQIA